MGAFGVVVGDEERDRKGALFLAGEVLRVQAFPLDRAVEGLGAAVGPGLTG